MYPVKLKFAVSTFLLIFFYFPKSINGHIESGTCDAKNSCTKHDKFDRKIFFGPQFRERETRMVNVRNRVGSEKLVNNRRIVDSDSRISDDIQSRNFDFPRLSRNSQDKRTNIISRARMIPRLTRDVFETIQTRRDIHTRASRNRVTERDSRNRIETGNTRRALVDNLDRESRTRRIVDVRESRLRESREIRLSTDNVRDFERLPSGVVEVDMARRQSRVSPVRRDVRIDQASRISRLFNNRESRTESRITRLGIDSNSREQPSDERRERRSLDGSIREVNRRLVEKESRERETRSHANNHRRMVDRDSRVPPVESRLVIDNRRLTERVERSSQRRDSERASREVSNGLPMRDSRDSQMRSLESQTTRLTERVERSSPDRRDSERASREVSMGLPMRDSRDSQIRSLVSQTTRLTKRVERSSPDRRNSERASREVNRRLSKRDSHERDTRASHTNDRRLLLDRDSRVQTIESRVTSQNTMLNERVERRQNSERAPQEINNRITEENARMRQIRKIDANGSRVRNIRITENRDSRVRSNAQSQIRERVTDRRHIEREIRIVRSYGTNNQRAGDGDSKILTQERSPVRLVESRRTTKNLEDRNVRNLREWSSPDRREQRNTGTERRDTNRDSRDGRTGATERRVSTADEVRNIRIQDRRIVSKREMKMTGASNDRSTEEQERQSENRNIRWGERRISDNSRRNARLSSEHPVDINNNRRTDINNNRRIRDQQTFADSSPDRSNQPNTIRMKSSENYIFKWSNLFTTTFGILLLMQIITSPNTKKYRIPQITSFLHGVKEKVY